MFYGERYINDVLVQPGAVVTERATSKDIFGAIVKAGARCDQVQPDESWVPLIVVDTTTAWEGPAESSFEAAREVAMTRARSRLRAAAVDIFS